MSERTEDMPPASLTLAEVEARKVERNRAIPGFVDTLELHRRPQWKGLGVSAVAAQVAEGRGPAVDDGTWGPGKIMEARVWLREEVARLTEVERTTTGRATVSLWLSILAACVSASALLISGAALWLKWTG